MLKVEHLSKTFVSEAGRLAAVQDVSFQLGEGEVYGLIGLSGAGKSTLVRCLNLLEKPDQGRVVFDGCDLTRLSEAALREKRKEIGMIFQHFNLFEQRSVFENVAFPLALQKIPAAEIKSRVNELLAYVELLDKANAYPAELSGGQKQRVAIARTLATRPRLLLSDEGTSALDPETTEAILRLLRRTVQDMGLSIVLITHQMEVAKNICDRIGVMEEGRIVEENSVEELFLRPKHKRTLRFVQSSQDEFTAAEHPLPIAGGRLCRLSFYDESVTAPVISHISREFGVDANLLAGNIHSLYKDRVGYLTVEFTGKAEAVEAALAWLRAHHVYVEELK